MSVTPGQIIAFWFSGRISKQWFSATPELDAEILDKYETVWEQASTGALDAWSSEPEGCLALVIILDQFPLNMFRGQARSFATETKAIEIARKAIEQGFDARIGRDKLAFLYMPFMHSEDPADQDLSVRLYRENKLEKNIAFAEHHREIVRKFGRFPHRNKILGRESTPEEVEYLASEQGFKG